MSRYRQNESWISNKFVGQPGIEAFMPNVNMGPEEKGFKHADMRRASRRTTCLQTMLKTWKAVAEQQEKLIEESATMGNTATAGAFYHRAAPHYGKAQLYHYKDNAMKLKLHISCARCYEKAIAGYDYTIEQVVLPFEGKNIYDIFHTPKGALNLPTVLFIPRMDMIKEDYPNLNDNFFIRGSTCALVMDSPGLGETRVHGPSVTFTSYPEAASLFLGWLCGRLEVSPDQIGILGGSMDSYYGPMVVVNNSRTKIVVGLLGCHLEEDLQFNSCQPGLCNDSKYICNIYNNDAFDEPVAEMISEKVVDRLKVPSLMSTGEFDEMCPSGLTERFFHILDCLKEMWIMEGEFHSCVGIYHELFAWAIDWLREALTTGKPENLEVRKVTPERWQHYKNTRR